MKVLSNEKGEEACSGASAGHGDGSENHHARLVPRFLFIFCASTAFLLLRWIDPVVAGSWLPFRTSCGAVTGLPCIFCGMTRALHLLLTGDFSGAIYFNWLAFPFLAAALFLTAVFAIEAARRRVIVNLSAILPITFGRLTVIGLCLFLVWVSQVYLAVSHHKHELLNPQGPLYALFVR